MTENKQLIVYPPYYEDDKYLSYIVKLIFENEDKSKNYWLLYPDMKDKIFWSVLYKSIDEKYDKVPYIIDKGSIVYHTNMTKDIKDYFISRERNIVYFGLDINICLWYGLEVYEYLYKFDKEKLDMNSNFYLHIYEVKRQIKYKYNSEKNNTLKEYEESSKIPLVGSQTVFHGNNFYYHELGTEMTLPYKLIRKKLNPIKTYRINILQLLMIKGVGLINKLPDICLEEI